MINITLLKIKTHQKKMLEPSTTSTYCPKEWDPEEIRPFRKLVPK